MKSGDEALSGPVGDAVGAALPGFGWLAGRLAIALRDEWRRNLSSALRAAERASRMSREDLEDFIQEHPVMVPLYLHVLWAAGMNGHDETLRAMGGALGDAARSIGDQDEDRVSAAEDGLRAMKDFTPRHFHGLRAIADRSPDEADPDANYLGVTVEEVAKATSMSTPAAARVLTNLAAAGLAIQVTVYDSGPAYPITEFGRAVLEAAACADDERRHRAP